MFSREQFLNDLRDALNRLQDPDHLRHSPLAGLFGVEGRFDTPRRLQRILMDGIEMLEPAAGEAHHSHGWRAYECLLYRYVQRFSQREVAEHLGICTRHVRRVQAAALDALALCLGDEYGLDESAARGLAASREEVSAEPEGPTFSLVDELEWLRDIRPDSAADLKKTLEETLELARSVAGRHDVRLDFVCPDGLPGVAVHPVALNQLILSLLTIAVSRASPGSVRVTAQPEQSNVAVNVQGMRDEPVSQKMTEEDLAGLGIAQHLVDVCGGRLDVSSAAEQFVAHLTLPAVGQLPVLVIDDNLDTLQLLERYTAGTPYRLFGIRDPQEALGAAEALSPQVIVLDVMMPQVDGWRVLGRLRQHPRTGNTPIVVCTILAQEELALSLGASAYIRKPVTRQAFLDALDQQAERADTESD